MTRVERRATRAQQTPRRGGRGRRGVVFGLGLGLGLGMVAAAGSASAHTGAVPIPPDSGYLIRWYQPHSARPVTDWEIEVATQRNPRSPYIVSAQVMPDASCWALNVPVTEPANVRIRSVAGSQVSLWSRATSVPEVGVGIGSLSASGFLAALARRRRPRIGSRRR